MLVGINNAASVTTHYSNAMFTWHRYLCSIHDVFPCLAFP